MKTIRKILLPILLLALVTSLFVAFTACEQAPTIPQSVWTTTSPDGKLVVTLENSNGAISYSVKQGETTVLDNSSMGFLLEEDNLKEILQFKEIKTERITGSYNNISGRNATVDYDCNQSIVTFAGSNYYLDVILRAYDDGYAFRYNIRQMEGGLDNVTVASEETTFALPTDSLVWMQNYKTNKIVEGSDREYFSYEEQYARSRSDNIDNRMAVMPLMYRAGDSNVYSLINESALIGSGYWGSFLQDAVEDGVGTLKTVHNTAGAMEYDNKLSLPFTSPWRTAAVGTLETIANNELTEKVYDDVSYWKPDNYDTLSAEEKEIYNYEWVEPGVTAWNWLIESSYGGVSQGDWDMQRKYVDLAEKMGWKYTVLDGGWDQNMSKAKEFTQYANSKGVKVIAWVDAYADFALGESADSFRSKMELWKSWGIDGIKIDFFDGQNQPDKLAHQGEDSRTIEWYEMIYQTCASLKMVVNCHGCNKPTGERRVYPNVINREAIYGNELYPATGDSTVNALFIRGPVGPTDFTPLVNPLRTKLTIGHQLALAALYESGQPSMAGRYYHYVEDLQTENPTFKDVADFYKILPAERDETRFVSGKLDSYYCSAMRSGTTWIVAGANAAGASRTAKVDLSFLGSGEYEATIYVDDLTVDAEGNVTKTAIKKTTETVTSATVKDMEMPDSGGFVICLTPKA